MTITRHVYRIYIKAPIESVWDALIEPELTRRYFHGTAFDSPPRHGERYRTSTADGRGAIDGTIEVLEAPHRLVMTWHTLYDAALADERPSRVEWQLSVVGEDLTQVDLVHGDLALSPRTWAVVRHGWVWILDGLKTLLETGDVLPGVADDPDGSVEVTSDDVAGDWHRAQGIECHSSIWDLLGRTDRTAEDDEDMVRQAYASLYHWGRATGRGPANEVRGEYMVARTHVALGNVDMARHHAERCHRLCVERGLTDFDLAYAHEAMARALELAGDAAAADIEMAKARQVPVADADDREILDADLAIPLR